MALIQASKLLEHFSHRHLHTCSTPVMGEFAQNDYQITNGHVKPAVKINKWTHEMLRWYGSTEIRSFTGKSSLNWRLAEWSVEHYFVIFRCFLKPPIFTGGHRTTVLAQLCLNCIPPRTHYTRILFMLAAATTDSIDVYHHFGLWEPFHFLKSQLVLAVVLAPDVTHVWYQTERSCDWRAKTAALFHLALFIFFFFFIFFSWLDLPVLPFFSEFIAKISRASPFSSHL